MYLLKLLAKYKSISTTIITVTIAAIGVIWNFDFQQLSPKIKLTPETILEIRMALILIMPTIFLIAFFILILYDHKKMKEQYETQIKDIRIKLSKKDITGTIKVVHLHDSELDKIK